MTAHGPDALDNLVHEAMRVVQKDLGLPPRCVFIFGSYVTSSSRATSDIDMLYVVSDGPGHRARFLVDDVAVDVFVETPSRLEALLARSEPVVVRMLAQGRPIYGSADALAGLRQQAAAMLAIPMPVNPQTVKAMRLRAVILLTALSESRNEIENEHLFCLLLAHCVSGYFFAHSLWPVSETSALGYVLQREPGIVDAVRTMLERGAELEIRRHAAHRFCTVTLGGLSGLGINPLR